MLPSGIAGRVEKPEGTGTPGDYRGECESKSCGERERSAEPEKNSHDGLLRLVLLLTVMVVANSIRDW
jgi:hypothetical protein